MSSVQLIWVKTQVANLIRYKPTGIYFSRAKVGGKLIRKSLRTKTFSVAKLRLADLLKEEQRKAELSKNSDNYRMTFGEAKERFLVQLENNPSLKPNTKKYRRDSIKSILKIWPQLDRTEVRNITEKECEIWAVKSAGRYAPRYHNNMIGSIRMVIDVAVKDGARSDNPASVVKKSRIRQKELQLPETDEFLQLVEIIRTTPSRFSPACANLVEFLAYTGCRKTEAANVHWRDIDFVKEEITVRGDPETGTKSGSIRRVPIIGDAMILLTSIRKARPDETGGMRVMEVQECQKSLDRACGIVGCQRITHHDLRHLFATRCIESDVDIPTVSRWLGHSDGGALAMKTYGHLRDHHSKAQAKKVSFSKSNSGNGVELTNEDAR